MVLAATLAALELGRFTLELIPRLTFFTDNTDFLSGKTRAEDPIYSVQGHLIYAFRSGLRGSLDATNSGQATIDGKRSGQPFDNSRIGGTLALPGPGPTSIRSASRGSTGGGRVAEQLRGKEKPDLGVLRGGGT